jgi:U3 small nucleolar RNA-associated protein 12
MGIAWDKVELVARVTALLVRINNNQLVATPAARSSLSKLACLIQSRTRELRDVIGFNLAALGHVSDALKERQHSFF